MDKTHKTIPQITLDKQKQNTQTQKKRKTKERK